MCAQISADDFIRAHHELGQVYYFISYKNQSIPFRDGVNPAAIDAVGSVMATVARTPEYLHSIGLLPFTENNTGKRN
jgi:peptidyl-dipeptidase A